MSVKQCNACGVIKSISEFNKRNDRPSGIRPECRECSKIRTRKWRTSEAGIKWEKAYTEDEEKQQLIRNNRRKPAAAQAAAARHKRWRDTPAGKDKLAKIAKRSQSKPSAKKRRSERRAQRYREDPIYSASVILRSMLNRACNKARTKKDGRTFEILGYTPDQFKQRMECQFKPGMTWDNRGQWHVDHKKPISRFVSQGVVDARIINVLCNLQPLWAEENMSKGMSFNPRQTEISQCRDRGGRT